MKSESFTKKGPGRIAKTSYPARFIISHKVTGLRGTSGNKLAIKAKNKSLTINHGK